MFNWRHIDRGLGGETGSIINYIWYAIMYILCCGMLWYTVIYCDTLWYTVIYCDTLWYTVIYYGIL